MGDIKETEVRIFLIVALCILISSKSFIYQQMHFISILENIKTHIKITSTCFGLRPSSGSLHVSLAKVICIKSVKVCSHGLCGCVAAHYSKSMLVCVLCAVQSEHSAQHIHYHGLDITCCHTTA
jgi:hypothetical protein